MTEIQFIEHSHGYRERTIQNVIQSDVTIAIASRYDTAGEILTKRSCIKHGKLYIALPLNDISFDIKPMYVDMDNPSRLRSIIDRICNLKKPEIKLNIAGNGIYSLDIGQLYLDMIIDAVIKIIVDKLKNKGISIILLRSGGQTGVDEAGLKAARALDIPSICLAPKGWTFRDINHKDISNEQLFKARFGSK